jgi:hypothetical protein
VREKLVWRNRRIFIPRVEVELFGREVAATVGTDELEKVDPDC